MFTLYTYTTIVWVRVCVLAWARLYWWRTKFSRDKIDLIRRRRRNWFLYVDSAHHHYHHRAPTNYTRVYFITFGTITMKCRCVCILLCYSNETCRASLYYIGFVLTHIESTRRRHRRRTLYIALIWNARVLAILRTCKKWCNLYWLVLYNLLTFVYNCYLIYVTKNNKCFYVGKYIHLRYKTFNWN